MRMTPSFRRLIPAVLPLLAACSSIAGPGHGVAVGQSFDLSPGQAVQVADAGTLRYEALVNDSRCRPDVQCIWAGDATLGFVWTPRGGRGERFTLHTQPAAAARRALGGNLTLQLLSLGQGEAPTATLRVEAAH
jgi:hypothetical protein